VSSRHNPSFINQRSSTRFTPIRKEHLPGLRVGRTFITSNDFITCCHRHARLYTLTDTAHVLTQSLSGLVCTWYSPLCLLQGLLRRYLPVSCVFPRLLVVSSSPVSSSVSAQAPSLSSICLSCKTKTSISSSSIPANALTCLHSPALCQHSGCSINFNTCIPVSLSPSVHVTPVLQTSLKQWIVLLLILKTIYNTCQCRHKLTIVINND